MNKYCLFFLSLLCFVSLNAQPKMDMLWERPYEPDPGTTEKINQVIWHPTGHLIAVGEVNYGKNKRDALIMIVDAETGDLVEREVFGGVDKNMLSSVTWGDWSFFAAGYTERNNGKGKDGWLLEIIWDGNGITYGIDTVFGGKGDDRFEKITWLSNGTPLLAGFNEELGSGNVWLVNPQKKGKVVEKSLGKGICKDIVGLEKSVDGKIWLCGNHRKNKGDVWWAQVFENGKTFRVVDVPTKNWEVLNYAHATREGHLVVGGRFLGKSASNSDLWAYEINANITKNGEVIFGSEGEQKFIGVMRDPYTNGHYWMVSEKKSFEHPQPINQLFVWSNLNEIDPIAKDKFSFDGDVVFQMTNVFRTGMNTYVMAGNELKGRKKRSKAHIKCWRNISLLAKKSATKSIYSLEHANEELVDENGNKALSPGESGKLKFTVINNDVTDVADGILTIESVELVKGMKVDTRKQYLEYLQAGEEITCSIPISTTTDLEAGVSKIQVRVAVNNVPQFQFEAEINSIIKQPALATANPQAQVAATWLQPNFSASASRKVPTMQEEIELKLNITSPTELQKENFKVYKNGTLLKDEKSARMSLTDPFKEGKIFQQIFTCKINKLDEVADGNEIYIELPNGQRLDPVYIDYQPEKPNLHILAFGANYDNLAFPSKDARDFAQAAVAQGRNGFFNEVFVDLYATPDSTTKTAIATAFNLLPQRVENTNLDNYIKPNDYLMIFISGHGDVIENQFKILPTHYNEYAPIATSLDYKTDILKFLDRIKDKCKVFMFIDACLSGHTLPDGAKKEAKLSTLLTRANQSNPGLTVFASCSPGELSYEDPQWKNGAFTKALLEAMKGQPVELTNQEKLYVDKNLLDNTGNDEEKRAISIAELNEFLSLRVPDLVKFGKGNGTEQTPMMTTNQLDETLPIFIIAQPQE